MATSRILWIAAHKQESFFTQFYLRKFEQVKCWSSERKYKCYPELLSPTRLTTEKWVCMEES